MEAARFSQGHQTQDDIKFATIVRNGKISMIPRET
jgi:uncharacterized membrane protein YcaP (DUF421 family)